MRIRGAERPVLVFDDKAAAISHATELIDHGGSLVVTTEHQELVCEPRQDFGCHS